MFCYLDLASLNCTELCIFMHLELSSEVSEKIFASSYAHKRGNIPYWAVYGSLYKCNNVAHAMRADVSRIKGKAFHIKFRYMAQKFSAPPKDVKSLEILTTLLNEQKQLAGLECEAVFSYAEKDGWKSLLELPILLQERTTKKALFTHIEGVSMTKRKRDQVQYAVQLRRTSEGTIMHSVYLSDVWNDLLSERVPKHILKRAAALSKGLVTKRRKE